MKSSAVVVSVSAKSHAPDGGGCCNASFIPRHYTTEGDRLPFWAYRGVLQRFLGLG